MQLCVHNNIYGTVLYAIYGTVCLNTPSRYNVNTHRMKGYFFGYHQINSLIFFIESSAVLWQFADFKHISLAKEIFH